MTKGEVCPELIRILRLQRHEFINHIQVVHALLQLGKTEKAKQYLEDLAKSPNLLTDTLSDHVRQDICDKLVEPPAQSLQGSERDATK